MNRPVKICLVLVAIALIAAAVRFDLLQYRNNRAYASFRQGDLNGALSDWSLLGDNKEAAYNRGVAFFRKGELEKAASEFKMAAASEKHAVRQKSLYNLGTVMLKSGISTSDQNTAKQRLETATSALQDALRLDAGDIDARHNEAIASSSLAAINRQISLKQQGEKTLQETPQAEQQAKQPEKVKKGEQSNQPGKPGKETAEGDAKGKARQARPMSKDDANRLLNDARGRETLRSATAANSKPSNMTPPAKDW
jgi:tetratricopeptide (TPR) repeat protein